MATVEVTDHSSFESRVAALSVICEAYNKLIAEEAADLLAPAETEKLQPALTNAR